MSGNPPLPLPLPVSEDAPPKPQKPDLSAVPFPRNRCVVPGFPSTWEDAQKEGYQSKKSWRKARRIAKTAGRKTILREREKERRKERKRIAREKGEQLYVRAKKYKMEDSENKQRICIDLDFSALMNVDEKKGTVNQVNMVYGINRRMEHPFQLYFCGIDDEIMQVAQQKRFFNNWDVNIKREKINEVFKPDDIVYLCAESPNVLQELDDTKVYIIGGLLDHNHHRAHCYNLAVKNNYGHARLPISENIKISSRHILTINQVMDIMAKVKMGKSWKEALLEVIPQRKQYDAVVVADGGGENGCDKADSDANSSTDTDKEGSKGECCSGSSVHDEADEPPMDSGNVIQEN